MKTVLLTAALAATAIGCGDVSTRGVETPAAMPSTSQTKTTPTPDKPVTTPDSNGPAAEPEMPELTTLTPQLVAPEASRHVFLRLSGANKDGLTEARFDVHKLRIRADGKDVPFTMENDAVNLAVADNSTKVAAFDLPEGSQSIQVTLDVDDDSGSYTATSGSGQITAPGMPITLEAKTDLMLLQHKVVVEVDLNRSLVEAGDGVRELVPVYRVRY